MSSLILDFSPLTRTHGTSSVHRDIEKQPQAEVFGTESPLNTLFRLYRWSVLLTYALFNVENLFNLARPWVVGMAINDLMASSYRGAALLAVQHLGHTLLSTWRQMYDARTFTRIYADLATRLVLQQRAQEVEVSRVAARSALSREIIDFFQHNLPFVFQSLYSVLGAVVMLAIYDRWMVPACLTLLLPVYLLSVTYARKSYILNQRLNDELEREVEVITHVQPHDVRAHYQKVAHWRTKLANFQAANFAMMSAFVLGLFVVALVRSCVVRAIDAGEIFALLGYVMMFVMGLVSTPAIVQQISRLRDINRRVSVRNSSPQSFPPATRSSK